MQSPTVEGELDHGAYPFMMNKKPRYKKRKTHFGEYFPSTCSLPAPGEIFLGDLLSSWRECFI